MLVALALALAASPPAAAFGPSHLPDASVRNDFAKAFAIDVGLVVDARAFDLDGDPRHPRIILGRYHERAGGPWIFPGLVVYGPCKLGMCLHRVHLGQAAKRVAPIAVIDLDAAQTTLELPRPDFEPYALTEPKTRAHWPALVLAAERQVEEPTRTDLLIVSLRTPDPAILLDHIFESRERDLTEAEVRDPSGTQRPGWVPIGVRLERIVLDGKTHRATLIERPIDSRWNGCLAPEPYPVDFTLSDGRFREVPPKVPRPIPCH